MSSDKYCCVPGCWESGGMHKVLHGFPKPEKDRERFNLWRCAIGGDILGLSHEIVYNYRRVCHSHFEDKYLCRNNRISNIAIPTLNLPGPELRNKSERKPLQEIQNQNLSEQSTSRDFSHLHQSAESKPISRVENLEMGKEDIGLIHLHQSMESKPSASVENLEIEKVNIDLSHPYQSAESKPISRVENLEMGKEVIDLIHPPQSTESQPLSSVKNLEIEKENIDPESQHCQHNIPSSKKVTANIISNPDKATKKNTRRLYLNNKEKELHMKLVATKIKLSKMKNKMKKQLAEIKAAKKLATNPAVLDTIEHFSSTAKLLMQIQWRENKKKEKGRRFTLKEKIVALSILKQSPKWYKFFRKIFILPAPQTLVKLIQQSDLRPGINKNIFAQLKKRTLSMSSEEKLCCVLYDEVSLKPHISYGERKDKVTGFVDNGHQRTPEFADHAQVFMVRGLIKNFKQPVAYTFSTSATKGPELAKQIKAVVTEVQQAGLNVVATICDQGTNNRQAYKILLNETRGIYLRRGEEAKENVILINEKEIVPLYDPPHLLKGLRNNLMTKNLVYEKDGKINTAKWSHLQLLMKENPGYKGIRMLPKLTENHVNPEKINKMKVKYASQIFSRTVASNMGYLADKAILPEECKETADLLLLVDNIFDSVNGSYKKNKNAKPLLGPATPTSQHKKTWAEAKKILKTMKYITAEGKTEFVPTISNWVWTLEGIEFLLKKLHKEYDITSVWLRHLNQDPLENFFGAVRSHGCRNVNPTCEQFEAAFCTLLINNINSVHTQGKNCEDDLCDALYALVVNQSTKEPSSTCFAVDLDDILNINFTPLEEKEKDPRKIAPLQYISGYFLKKAKSKIFHGCTDCKNDLISEEEIEYISYREYAGRRWLCTPSKALIILISNMQDVINVILNKYLEKPDLNEVIKTVMMILINFNFLKCNAHKQKNIDYLIKIVNRCLIFNYCKYINKILAGRIVEIEDNDDRFQVKAMKHMKKCSKRKK